MTRAGLRSLIAAAAILASLPAVPAAQAEPARNDATTTLTALSPAVLPAKGAISLTGVVTNKTDSGMHSASVQLVSSSSPLGDPAQLARASANPDSVSLTPSSAKPLSIGEVAAGQSTPFTLQVDRAQLSMRNTPGIYIVGVTITATGDAGQTISSSARTFYPLVGGAARSATSPAGGVTPLSLIIPMRAPVILGPKGTIGSGFDALLGPDGRLGRVAALGSQAGSSPVTWLVDPAVLDAAERISVGNPGYLVGTATETPPVISPPVAGNSTTFLSVALAALRANSVLALPYADADAVALARSNSRMLGEARALSTSSLGDLHVPSSPAIAPPEHAATEVALGSMDTGSTAIVGDIGVNGPNPVRQISGRRVVATTTATAAGGPGGARDALNMRQRILADAALRASAGNALPFIVELPDDWDPGANADAAGFFAGFNQPWLQVNPLPAGDAVSTQLSYPDSARKAEIGAANQTSATKLMQATSALTSVVSLTPALAPMLREQLGLAAFGAVSYSARANPANSRQFADNATSTFDSLLSSIVVDGTNFVTLSGGSGVATVSVANGLNREISIGVREVAGGKGVTIDPLPAFVLEAGQRSTVRLHLQSRGVDVQQVKLSAVSAAGDPVGTQLAFTLRTSQVGTVVWVIIGAGIAMALFVVGRRLAARLRAPKEN